MAGCSIVVLMILFSPLLLVLSLACLIAQVAVEFVTSIAFPFFVASCVLGVLAAGDVVRILYQAYRAERLRELRLGDMKRPALFALLAMVAFVITVVLAGSMLVAWYRSL